MSTADTIRHGMARAFFASAWADAHDESGRSFPPGTEITSVMPVITDPAALHAADTLIKGMETANHVTVQEMYAIEPGGLKPSLWGHYAAMQAMGHGVGLHDYGIDNVVVPYVEFGSHSLERDYFQ